MLTLSFIIDKIRMRLETKGGRESMTKLEAIEAGHIRMKIKNLTAEYRLAEQGKSNFCTVELEVIIDKLRQRLELLML